MVFWTPPGLAEPERLWRAVSQYIGVISQTNDAVTQGCDAIPQTCDTTSQVNKMISQTYDGGPQLPGTQL